jgi:hypothetical protein
MLRAVLRRYALLILVAGCGDAITLEIDSDRPIPQAIDGICVGVADTNAGGGHFGQTYAVDKLPQTLRVEAGDADSALAWVRADRGGSPVLYRAAQINFGGDVTVALDKCQVGRSSTPAPRGSAIGPPGALIAASHGQGGTLVVAVAAGAASLVGVRNGALAGYESPAVPAGNPVALVTADLDGDCDDDAIIATDAAAPVVWIREGAKFREAGSIGDVTVAALATADADHDGDTDVILGGGNRLQLWRNDGAGNLALSNGLSAGTRATAISALALGDLDGDGNPDLVVGQAGPPLVAWLGSVATFTPADGVVPPVALDVKRLTLADADNDFDPDLAVSIAGAPMRLYIDRDGRLEDQSFVRLPQPAPVAKGVAIGGWDAGCEPDLVIAGDASAALRGLPTSNFELDASAPAASDAIFVDIDDDGDLDAILSTTEGVQWLAR